MKFYFLIVAVFLYMFSFGQDFYDEANQLKEGKYWVVMEEYRKDKSDISDLKYKLDVYVKAEITDIIKDEKEVKSFTINHGTGYRGLKPVIDHASWPLGYMSFKGFNLVLFPYQGGLYILSRPFLTTEENEFNFSSFTRKAHDEVYIMGWISKKKPKLVNGDKKNAICPVTVEELKKVADKHIRRRNKSLELEEESQKNREVTYTIENKKIVDIKLLNDHKIEDNGWGGSDFIFVLGLEATFADGTVSKSSNFGGHGFLDDYILEVYGAEESYYSSKKDGYESSIAFEYKTTTTNVDRTCDCIDVTVRSKFSNEVLLTKKVALPYNYDLITRFMIEKGYYGYEGSPGADLDIKVEQKFHAQTGEEILLYTINYKKENESGVRYVRLKPSNSLFIMHNGGDGGNSSSGGKKGGRKGLYNVKVGDDVLEYHLDHQSYDGSDGNYEYVAQTSNNDDYSSNGSTESSDFTITNNTGTMIRLIDEGGNGEGSLNDGSSKTFDCDEVIYQAKENGSGTWNVKGRLIADGESACGQSISFK